MGKSTRKFMRLLVFFDLPMTTKREKRAYVVFRRFLINDGYDMIQWSVYGRITNGIDNANTHLLRLAKNLPPAGSVRCLMISEKQFTNMRILVGIKKEQEIKVTSSQMILF